MTAPLAPTIPAEPAVPAAPPVVPTPPETFDRAYVEGLRREAAGYRTKVEAAETAATTARTEADARIQAVLTAAGITTGQDPAEVAKQFAAERDTAAAERDTARKEANALKVENALGRAARTHKADEDLLTAVLAHEGKLTGLDPAAADVATTLDALVKQTVEGNPKLKAALGAGTSGAEFSGGSGESGQITDAQLASMSPQEIAKAHKEGRLNHLL
jgi:hypothetical protein